ncbi:MAG: hypothetical protein QNJ85_18235 [Gammaproteobacteria bacterium]|nr:hypothetical protein [Gammaproteobacteria bacterium]
MNIIVITAIGMGAAIALMWFLFRPYDYGSGAPKLFRIGARETKLRPEEDTEWRSARIRPGLNCCAMVKSLEGQVFLAREVPVLPLAYCSESRCSCHYLFEADRRSGSDRRVELARVSARLTGLDRRQSPGRRVGDLSPA